MAGRPRSTAVDRALTDAALVTFAEHGFEGLTFDQVARLAKVSRAALYRRWSNREDLLADALAEWRAAIDPVSTGGPPPALDAMLDLFADSVATAFGDSFTRSLLRRLLTLPPEARSVAERHFGMTVAARRAPFTAAIRAAQREGRVDPAIDIAVAQDAVAGALAYALLSGAADAPDFTPAAYTRALFRTVGLIPHET